MRRNTSGYWFRARRLEHGSGKIEGWYAYLDHTFLGIVVREAHIWKGFFADEERDTRYALGDTREKCADVLTGYGKAYGESQDQAALKHLQSLKAGAHS